MRASRDRSELLASLTRKHGHNLLGEPAQRLVEDQRAMRAGLERAMQELQADSQSAIDRNKDEILRLEALAESRSVSLKRVQRETRAPTRLTDSQQHNLTALGVAIDDARRKCDAAVGDNNRAAARIEELQTVDDHLKALLPASSGPTAPTASSSAAAASGSSTAAQQQGDATRIAQVPYRQFLWPVSALRPCPPRNVKTLVSEAVSNEPSSNTSSAWFMGSTTIPPTVFVPLRPTSIHAPYGMVSGAAATGRDKVYGQRRAPRRYSHPSRYGIVPLYMIESTLTFRRKQAPPVFTTASASPPGIQPYRYPPPSPTV